MTVKEQIARRVLMIRGELEFAISVNALRRAVELRRQLAFWTQQQEDEKNKTPDAVL